MSEPASRSVAIEEHLAGLTERERAAVLACLDALSRPLHPTELERTLRARLSRRDARIATALLKGAAIMVMVGAEQ